MSTLTEQLTKVAERYDELNQLMADPEVLADYERLNALAQERSDLEELVTTFRRFEDVEQQIVENRELIRKTVTLNWLNSPSWNWKR